MFRSIAVWAQLISFNTSKVGSNTIPLRFLIYRWRSSLQTCSICSLVTFKRISVMVLRIFNICKTFSYNRALQLQEMVVFTNSSGVKGTGGGGVTFLTKGDFLSSSEFSLSLSWKFYIYNIRLYKVFHDKIHQLTHKKV